MEGHTLWHLAFLKCYLETKSQSHKHSLRASCNLRECLLARGAMGMLLLYEWTVDPLQGFSLCSPSPRPRQGPGHATYPINKCLLKVQVNERK